MKIDQLSYFLETARTEHIGKASRALHISPSAVSHSIAALEAELGRKLFERKGKSIHLTNHGKLLKERAEALLRQIETIRNELQADDVDYRGHYRVAASHVLAARALTPACARFQANRPHLTFDIFSLRSAQVVEGVLRGDFDIGLCFSPQGHPELDCRNVHEGQLVIAIGKRHPLMKAKAVDRFRKIAVYKAVLPKAFPGIDVCEDHPVFKAAGLQPDSDCRFDNYEVAVEKVACSDSWGFFPDWIVALHADRLHAVRVPEGWNAPYRVSLVTPKSRIQPRVLQLLGDEIGGYFAETMPRD